MRSRYTGVVLSALFAAAVLVRPTSSVADDLALPRGSRPAPGGAHTSGLGFRDTLAFFARALARRGVDVETIGPYRRRGVTVVRLVARAPRAPLRAVHVWTAAGRTYVFVVPSDPARTPVTEPLDRVPAPR